MEDKITLEQVCETWRRTPGESHDHLASPVLSGLAHQPLSEQNTRQAFYHLAACPACLEALTPLLEPEHDTEAVAPRQAESAPIRLTVQWPLAAAGAAPADRITVPDTSQRVECRIVRQGDSTILAFRVKPAYQAAFEHAYVRVFDANGQELCSGPLVRGTLACSVSRRLAGDLTLAVTQKAPGEPPEAC